MTAANEVPKRCRVDDTLYRLVPVDSFLGRLQWAVEADGVMLGVPTDYEHALKGFLAITG